MPDRVVARAGREAFARRAWSEAVQALAAADRDDPLAAEDLERLGTAAFLAGRDEASAEAWTRAYHAHLDAGRPIRAAHAAFWIGFQAIPSGDMARAGGWVARAQRLLDDAGEDVPERGLVLVPVGAQTLFAGDAPGALEVFERAAAIGRRFGDADLVTLAAFGAGQALVALGRVPEGIVSFDEAMVAVAADEVSPVIAGVVYCGVIGTCYDLFDVRRAREWTHALTAWCASQPGLVPFRGQCLVHRAQVMQLGGEWAGAIDEAERARALLSEPPQPAVGIALYQLGELHRLRGDTERAEQAYREGSDAGRSPLPGLALLRLAQGRSDAARAGIRRALDEARDAGSRSRLLPAAVEILIACNDVDGARTAAAELSEFAAALDAPYLSASGSHARGWVHLAAGDHAAAVSELREAASAWQRLAAPYEAARARALIAQCCRALGDQDGAALEEQAARRTFEDLGAAPDLARLDGSKGRAASGVLTARETEVLALVATGKTSREVAATLFISEKTVERHLSNIFTKLGLSGRVAAVAYAYEHGLI